MGFGGCSHDRRNYFGRVVFPLVLRMLLLEMLQVLGLGLELGLMAVAVPNPAVLVFMVNPLLLYAVETVRIGTVLVRAMVRL